MFGIVAFSGVKPWFSAWLPDRRGHARGGLFPDRVTGAGLDPVAAVPGPCG